MLSKNNIKYIQSLHQKKRRDEESVFIVEGPKIVDELLQSSWAVKQIYATEGDWLHTNKNRTIIKEITDVDLRKISCLEAPNQVLALVEMNPLYKTVPTIKELCIVLDGIQDPGNLGTIIRIADWYGISSIIASYDTADVYNPKTIRATMGSIFRVGVHYTSLDTFLAQSQLPLYAAMLDGKDVRTLGSIQKGAILIGNESRGIRSHLHEWIQPNNKITIPALGKAESLNAAVALGIILSHVR